MIFAQAYEIDHSWNKLPGYDPYPAPITSDCGCSSSFAADQAMLSPCCNNSECKSGFCLCTSPTSTGMCYIAPSYTVCTADKYCSTYTCFSEF